MQDLPKAADFIGEDGVKVAVDTLREIAADPGEAETRLRAAETLLNWGASAPWHYERPVDPEPEA